MGIGDDGLELHNKERFRPALEMKTLDFGHVMRIYATFPR